jgi:hypothetical protein
MIYKDFDKIYKCEITDDEDWSPRPYTPAEDKATNETFVRQKVRRVRPNGYQ